MHARASAEQLAAGSSLPLLVRMPDGERHQVDLAASSSIRQLRDSITPLMDSWAGGAPATPGPHAEWDLDFAGSILKDSATLGDYHIPDVYDHASGLLRTISESPHTNAGKKVEALDKACAVVVGISKGERDMERLIASVFNEEHANAPPDDTAQPSIRTLKRKGRSKIPSLNFAHLPPALPFDSSTKPSGSPRQPPTPNQLMRRLSTSRPDLYNPAVVARADAADPAAQSGEIKKRSSWFTEAVAIGAPDQGGSGLLKRENTWFKDVISEFENRAAAGKHDFPHPDVHDDVGDSEGELEQDRNDIGKTAPQPTGAAGSTHNTDDAASAKGSPASRDSLDSPANAADKPANNNPDGENTNASPSNNPHHSDSDTNKSKANPSAAIGAAVAAAAAAAGTLPKDSSVGGTQSANAPGNTTTASASSAATGVEQQVIGLNPEHPHVEDDSKLPKKRGRKRKNPHLTEEQRKLQRQAQNRESAKLSRIRRKNMTAEYEKRVTTLEGENENLRDTVAALTDRLEILQNLLTISVQRRPVQAGPLGQPILPPQSVGHGLMPSAAPTAPLPASIVPPASMPHHHQIANFNYKSY